MPRLQTFAWLTLVGAAACSVVHERTAADLTAITELRAADFPGADAILRGFAAPDDDPALRVGDAALFGLALTKDGEVQRQLLLLEVTQLDAAAAKFADHAITLRRTTEAVVTTTGADGTERKETLTLHDVGVSLRRFGADGRELASARAVLYEEALCAGFWPDADPAANRRDRLLASVLAVSLQNLANGEPTLQELLFTVVDPPGLWSIATHLGVHVGLRTGFGAADAAPPPALPAAAGEELRRSPMDVAINGSDALWADLLVVRPCGANMVAGGLVAGVARNPRDPGRGATIALLATRRGGPSSR